MTANLEEVGHILEALSKDEPAERRAMLVAAGISVYVASWLQGEGRSASHIAATIARVVKSLEPEPAQPGA